KLKDLEESLRWQGVWPSPLLYWKGKYKNTPFAERLCSCPLREIETTEHMLFTCPLYEAASKEFIIPLMERIPGCSEGKRLVFLLSDADTKNTCQMARFCMH
ncbi:hypothetical protein JRQ81_005173, partial [Phrynocephalus forsythii]